MTRFIQTLVFGLFLLLNAAPMAAQYTVDSFLDGQDANPADGICATLGGDCTLRAAMQQAEADNVPTVITLPEGTYTWSLGELAIDQGDITVNGGGTRTTIVDAQGGQRFWEFDGNNTLVTIRDLELRNGLSTNDPGGAFHTDADLVTVERVCFRNCVTQDAFGGAIHNREDLEVYACSFIDCKAFGNDGQNGGGGGGGGLGAGGAISVWSGSSAIIENSTFTGCEAHGGDGGNAGGAGGGGNGGNGIGSFGNGGDGGDITSSTWGVNNPDAGGGGFGGGGGGGGVLTSWWNPGGGDASNGLGIGGNGGDGTVNSAGSGGGGGGLGGAVFMRSGELTMLHCTVSGNGAFGGQPGTALGNQGSAGEGRGGGIGCYDGTVTLDNCILYGNAGGTASGDEDLYHFTGDPIMASAGSNIIGVVDAGVTFDAAVTGNQIGVDPVLLAFGDYGGPTDVFMVSACEPLSPAIGAAATLGVTMDQRGEPRDAAPDIGAVEGPVPVTVAPLVGQVCPGESIELTLTWPGGETTWPDGSTGDTWETGALVSTAMITTEEGCEEEVDLSVTEVNIVQPDLGPDQIVCPGTPVNLDAGNPGAQFDWSVGGAGQFALVVDSGLVEVTVMVDGCTASDEMQVNWYATYPLDLGEDVVLCFGEDVTLDAQAQGWSGLPPAFQWQAGPADSEFTVTSAGVYTVTATLNGCVSQDQVVVTESPLTTVDLGADQVICPGAPFVLDPNYPTAVCTWQDGSVSDTYNVTNTGIYSVNVALGDCQANAQVFVEVVNGFEANLPDVATYCTGDSVLLLAAFGAANYTWQNGAVGNQLWASAPGIYQVSSTVDGCTFTDQVSVVAQPLPVFDLGLDIILCEGESIDLAPNVPGADYVIFNDSLTTPSLTVEEGGTYMAEVSQGGCVFRDTVSVEVRPIPEFALPADTLLCPGTVLTLETGLSDVLVTWNTGEVGTSIDANMPATFVATSQVSGCQFTDSIVVDVAQPIVIPLASTYALCLDDTIMLNAAQGPEVYPSTYRWDDGHPLPMRVFDKGGVFEVEVLNVCDTATHILEIEQYVCGCQIYVPSAFTPNNDGKNDAWFPVLDCDPFTYEVTVWDRWGRPVFQSTTPDEVWYGQVEGTPGSKTRESGRYYAIDGVYMWEVIIELRTDGIPEVIRQNGTVHVLR